MVMLNCRFFRHSRRSIQSSRGVALLEVLIAILVLSVGLLGQSGMQASTLRVNHGALVRSQSTALAYDVFDRMRANAPAAAAGAYDIDIGDSPGSGSLADADLDDWKSRLAAALPDGDGAICRRGDTTALGCEGSGDFFVVQINWTESDQANRNRVTQTFRIVGRL